MQNPLKPHCFAKEALQQLMQQSPEKFMILDLRSHEEFMERHIPGAFNFSLTELIERTVDLPKQTIIITTCGKGGGRSAQGADQLKKSGFLNVHHLCGGNVEWFGK